MRMHPTLHDLANPPYIIDYKKNKIFSDLSLHQRMYYIHYLIRFETVLIYYGSIKKYWEERSWYSTLTITGRTALRLGAQWRYLIQNQDGQMVGDVLSNTIGQSEYSLGNSF